MTPWLNLTIDQVRSTVAGWGPWGPIASVLITVINTFLPFPMDAMIMANGAIFGIWEGLLVSLAGAMASACLAFGIARIAGRAAARRVLRPEWLAWLDTAVAEGGWRTVLVIQFIPLLPYSLLNFAFGLTSVRWPTFLWITLLSILPADILLSALGDSVAETRAVLRLVIAALAVFTGLTLWLRGRMARTLKFPAKPA
jgi:uncharacterized membrane protein YdjX (TVP38/TMEM64 family)